MPKSIKGSDGSHRISYLDYQTIATYKVLINPSITLIYSPYVYLYGEWIEWEPNNAWELEIDLNR